MPAEPVLSPDKVTSSSAITNLVHLEQDNLKKWGVYERTFFGGKWHTNADDLLAAGRLARVLYEHGVRPGRKVLTVLPNSPELIWSLHAIWILGAVAVPAPVMCTATELAYLLKHSRATTLLSVPALSNQVWAVANLVGGINCLTFGDAGLAALLDISTAMSSGPIYDNIMSCGPDYAAMILYTSGTTARPKGVVLTHGNIAAAMDAVTAVNPHVARVPMLHVLPMTHIFGLLMIQLANAWGLKSVILPQFEPLATLQAIERHHIGYLPAVPTMLGYLVSHPESSKFNLKSLQRVITGGGPLPETIRKAFENAVGCRVDQGYGMTETGFSACYSDNETYRAGSVGRPCPGFEARIMDDNGTPLPEMWRGEICLKGESITHSYWADPEASKEAFTDGWFRTGDIGYIDRDGYIFIVDRKKDLIIKGGENISPREIEDVLCAHPGVLDAAVIGVKDERFGEEICAVVQRRPGNDVGEDALIEFAAARLNKFKLPARIVFETMLPRTPAGKISKRILRDQMSLVKT